MISECPVTNVTAVLPSSTSREHCRRDRKNIRVEEGMGGAVWHANLGHGMTPQITDAVITCTKSIQHWTCQQSDLEGRGEAELMRIYLAHH